MTTNNMTAYKLLALMDEGELVVRMRSDGDLSGVRRDVILHVLTGMDTDEGIAVGAVTYMFQEAGCLMNLEETFPFDTTREALHSWAVGFAREFSMHEGWQSDEVIAATYGQLHGFETVAITHLARLYGMLYEVRKAGEGARGQVFDIMHYRLNALINHLLAEVRASGRPSV